MNRFDSDLKRFNAALEEKMKDAYWHWIDAHRPNDKPRLKALWDERLRLQARIAEIETELAKHANDAIMDIEKRRVEPFLTQFAVERKYEHD